MPTRVRNKFKTTQGPTGLPGIATSEPMRAELLRHVTRGKVYAEGIVSPKRTGFYASQFEVSLGTRHKGKKLRAEGRLRNVAPYAAAIEWGTLPGPGHAGTRARRPLGRTQAFLRRGEG